MMTDISKTHYQVLTIHLDDGRLITATIPATLDPESIVNLLKISVSKPNPMPADTSWAILVAGGD
jgi:hypothetical protein